MLLTDVNVLVYAFRGDAPDHGLYRAWLEALLASRETFGVSELVLSGFLRIVTHPGIFVPPTPVPIATEFAQLLRQAPNCLPVRAGPRHWDIFVQLCQHANTRGNRVADAYHAALALESGCEWVTTDRGFARFPDLRWRHPLDPR